MKINTITFIWSQMQNHVQSNLLTRCMNNNEKKKEKKFYIFQINLHSLSEYDHVMLHII